jgi:hypothetical protein
MAKAELGQDFSKHIYISPANRSLHRLLEIIIYHPGLVQ